MGFCKDAHSWMAKKRIHTHLESVESGRKLDDMAQTVLADPQRIEILERKSSSTLVEMREWIKKRRLSAS